MKTLACPGCGRKIDLETAALDELAREEIALGACFGPQAHLVWAYIELFGCRPVSTPHRTLALLQGLKRLWDAESFTFNKRLYPISHAGIAEALGIACRQNFTNRLTNDNYLKKVMITISEREAQEKSRASERDLRRKEASLQSGRERATYPDIEETWRHVEQSRPDGLLTLTDEEREANLRRVQSLQRQIWEVKGE